MYVLNMFGLTKSFKENVPEYAIFMLMSWTDASQTCITYRIQYL